MGALRWWSHVSWIMYALIWVKRLGTLSGIYSPPLFISNWLSSGFSGGANTPWKVCVQQNGPKTGNKVLMNEQQKGTLAPGSLVSKDGGSTLRLRFWVAGTLRSCDVILQCEHPSRTDAILWWHTVTRSRRLPIPTPMPLSFSPLSLTTSWPLFLSALSSFNQPLFHLSTFLPLAFLSWVYFSCHPFLFTRLL